MDMLKLLQNNKGEQLPSAKKNQISTAGLPHTGATDFDATDFDDLILFLSKGEAQVYLTHHSCTTKAGKG